jgi:hypothetical protein
VKAKANALGIELGRTGNVEKEPNADTCRLSNKPRDMDAWGDHISHESDFSNQLNADFNCPQINLIYN